MSLHNRLKEYRAKLDINQQEMGRRVGASRQTISLIERGDYSPSVTLALKIAPKNAERLWRIFFGMWRTGMNRNRKEKKGYLEFMIIILVSGLFGGVGAFSHRRSPAGMWRNWAGFWKVSLAGAPFI